MNLLSSFLVSTALAGEPVDLPQVEPSVLDLTVRPELEAVMLQMLTVEIGLFSQSCNVQASGHGASPIHSFAFSDGPSLGRMHAELASADPANHAYLGFRDTAKTHRCLGRFLATNPRFIGEASGYDYVCEPNLMGARVTDPGFIFPKTTRVLLPYLSCEFTPVVGEI
jgi:hypothetical protein